MEVKSLQCNSRVDSSCDCCLTSDVREALSRLPAVWASAWAFVVFIQAGFAVDPPTACHLVGTVRHSLTDLTHQFVWWCLHKLAVIATNCGSTGCHLLKKYSIIYFVELYNMQVVLLHTDSILTLNMQTQWDSASVWLGRCRYRRLPSPSWVYS